jgi:hypothetical protein
MISHPSRVDAEKMTDEELDYWFEEINEITAEYGRFCKIIIEDLKNPDTPQIIKDYLTDLDQKCNIKKEEI